MIYWRCYVEAFGRATSALSMLDRGAYRDLLDHYYLKERPLPLNSDELARICRAITLEERAAIDKVLNSFFIRKPDGWHNDRADHEIAVSKTARENGKMGGRPAREEVNEATESVTKCETAAGTEYESESGTGSEPREGGGSGHPFSLSTKTSLSTKPTLSTKVKNPAPRKARRPPEPGSEAPTGSTWNAYAEAYQTRYGVAPIRNAKVNASLKSLVDQVGQSEAPHVAAWYLGSSEAFYVTKKHAAEFLAKDAAKLRTEWATGVHGTATAARLADATAARGAVFTKLVAEAEAVLEVDGDVSWWADPEQVSIQGEAHGVRVIAGQPWDDYVARVFAAMGPGEWVEAADLGMRERVQYFLDVGINPPQASSGRPQPIQRGG